jgi:hypothetical protein
MTVDEAAKFLLGEDAVYDVALPQSWFQEFLDYFGWNPCGSFVWHYPKGSIFGQPEPLTVEARDALYRTNRV